MSIDKKSIDGASLGLDAEKSLRVVLGGESINEQDVRTPQQMREYIMSAPESYEEGCKSYEEAARWLAKQYLILLDSNYEGSLWMKVKEKFDNKDFGFTGFMIGWAENAARYCKGMSEKENPAIVEI